MRPARQGRNVARVTVGDIAIAFEDAGRGPPVVLVHGLACGKRMWFHQTRALRGRFRVITYDQRGHGLTDAPDDPARYSAAHLYRDLLGLLDALGIERAAVVGFSLGGGPALALALGRPERVSRLVLADVGAGADDLWRSQWLARRWVDLAGRDGADALVADMLRADFYKVYANRGGRYRWHMAGLIRATPPAGLRHTLTEVIGKRRSLFRMKSELRSVRVPTRMIVGQHDYVCRNAMRLLAESIPGASTTVIRGAGHMSPLEEPKAFNDALLEFLDDGAIGAATV